jgi:hypothetical protein
VFFVVDMNKALFIIIRLKSKACIRAVQQQNPNTIKQANLIDKNKPLSNTVKIYSMAKDHQKKVI